MADAANVKQINKANAGLMVMPLRLIVSPATTWAEFSKVTNPTPALLLQLMLLALGRIIAWQPMNDMTQMVGGDPASVSGFWTVISELVMMAVLTCVVNLMLAALLFFAFSLLGIKQPFLRLLFWVSCALIPICLGYLVGTIPLWFIQPLSTGIASILAWQYKPFSLGLAAFLPEFFSPLSAQWCFAVTFDFFGCWALLLFYSGSRYYLKFDFYRSLWITCGLVLIFLAAASGMWQVFQTLIVSRG